MKMWMSQCRSEIRLHILHCPKASCVVNSKERVNFTLNGLLLLVLSLSSENGAV